LYADSRAPGGRVSLCAVDCRNGRRGGARDGDPINQLEELVFDAPFAAPGRMTERGVQFF